VFPTHDDETVMNGPPEMCGTPGNLLESDTGHWRRDASEGEVGSGGCGAVVCH